MGSLQALHYHWWQCITCKELKNPFWHRGIYPHLAGTLPYVLTTEHRTSFHTAHHTRLMPRKEHSSGRPQQGLPQLLLSWSTFYPCTSSMFMYPLYLQPHAEKLFCYWKNQKRPEAGQKGTIRDWGQWIYCRKKNSMMAC